MTLFIKSLIVTETGGRGPLISNTNIPKKRIFVSFFTFSIIENDRKKKIENSFNFLSGGEKTRVSIFHLRNFSKLV